MTTEEQIKDLNLQIEVYKELYSKATGEIALARDYLLTCHAILDECDVPQCRIVDGERILGKVPLHERLLWFIESTTGKFIPMPCRKPDNSEPL